MYNKFNLNQKQSVKKIISIMRLLVFFMIFGCSISIASNSYSQTKILSINMDNKTVAEVISEIEKNSEYVFFFYDEALDKERIVSINLKDQKVDVILDKLFENTDNKYLIFDRQITISRKAETASLPILLQPLKEQQQGIAITGTVVDNEGFPLPGVTIMIKGTTRGTATDSDGKFSITVPDRNAVLVFSYIGYSTLEQAVGTQTALNITLHDETEQLSEVVVVGYGTQKKQSVVGSIAQANNEELSRSGNVTDVRQALTGRLPGVITTMSTGEPGGYQDGSSATSIFIRGRNSWNNSQPLILVDGVERNMDNVDISEIETISVLKDASATAVFGVKGANGVILITTRRGQDRRPEISISYDATALMISKLPDKLDSYDALRLRNESIERDVSLNGNLWGSYTPMEILRRYRERDYPEYEWVYPNVDWQKALYKDVGWSQRASLNIRGGTNFVKYFGSLSYLHEGDMFRDYENYKSYDPNYDFNRFNFRSNFDFKLTKTTDFSINLAGFFSQKNTNTSYTQDTNGVNQMIFAAAYNMPPDFYMPQLPDGSWGTNRESVEQYQNPVAQIYNLGIHERRTTSLNADFHLTQKLDFITKGLSLRGSFFYDNSIQTIARLTDVTNSIIPGPGANTALTIVNQSMYTGHGQDPSEYMESAIPNAAADFDWVIRPWSRGAEAISATDYRGGLPIDRRTMYQLQLNYARTFQLHNVGAMGLFKREENARGSQFPYYREDWVFRATYDYDTKYLLEVNGAYNGSEKFSPDYRFDFFPSFSAGWYLSNEKFYKIDWLNRVKLRYSIGWVGDDSGGARWLYQAQYSYGDAARMQQNATGSTSLSPYVFYNESVVPNPDARWEKAKKTNYAVELGILNDLISANLEYFTESRWDMMIAGGSRAIPPYFGATAPAANLGKLDASGYEVQVEFKKNTAYGLDYWIAATMTHTRNKVVFRDDPVLMFSYQKAQDYAMSQSRSQIRTEIYQNWDQVYASVPQTTNDQNKIPGFYNILDFNGDGVITGDDSAPTGYPDVPENTYNLNLGISYKGFSATVQFYGVNNVTRNVPITSFDAGYSAVYGYAYDYWSKDNPNASSFLPRYLTPGSFYGNFFLYDGSFIRLKTAEISYDFQKPVLAKLGVASLKLFVNGNNLWWWSKLPDDRENSWSGGSANRGSYPTLKRINSGIKITF